MKRFVKDRKFLIGLTLSMVLAMAVGSFAMGEAGSGTGTPASPQAVESQSAATNDGTGDFVVDDGTASSDYSFDPNQGVLTIHGTHTISMATGATLPTAQRIFVDDTANITLSGINIETGNGAALEIQDNAMLSVTITLEGKNILTSTSRNCAGLQKADYGSDTGTLTITGAGTLKATGGEFGAGIGGGCGSYGMDASNIDIDNTTVEAYGGGSAAGIGGGQFGTGRRIKITNSIVKAVGSDGNFDDDWAAAAGIGGGYTGNGSKITISNSNITAIGGSGDSHCDDEYDYYLEFTAAAAIGGGSGFLTNGELEIDPGTGSENQIDDSSILIAKGGNDGDGYSIETLQGFDEDLAGLVFEQKTDSEVNAGTVYGDIVLKNDFTMPKSATLTIPQNKSLTINASKTLTVPDGSALINDGTLTINGTLSCTDTGKIETLLNYDPQGGSIKENEDSYKTYKDASGIKTYETLPEAEKDGYTFDGWYTEKEGKGTKIEENSNVLLNQHILYANYMEEKYKVTIDQIENGSITSDVTEAAEGGTVTLTVIPADGYQLQDGSFEVTDADGKEVTVTEKEGKYTFTMPGSAVTISAVFEQIPGPEPTPEPIPTPDPSVNPDQGGDGSGSGASSKTGDPFMEGTALALLGIAATGAVILRKRK